MGRQTRRPPRRGFIVFFGWRSLHGNDKHIPPLEIPCPRCNQPAQMHSRWFQRWFTLFFIPVFPISARTHFSQCSLCASQFKLTLDQLRSRLSEADQNQSQQAITLYNSLRASPGNSITLNNVMMMYASMKEYDLAVSAAREFPQALHASEQCMATLGRVLLAQGNHQQAVQWFDAALARDPAQGESLYHKAIALMSMTPPDLEAAVAAARLARNSSYPRADELLSDLEERNRAAWAKPQNP